MFKKYAIEALLALIAVFAPIKTVMITVGVLIIADMLLGMWAAKKQGIPITSEKLSHTLVKIFMYEIAVCLAFLVETYLMEGILPVCKIVGSIIGSVELKSILENVQGIQGQPIFNSLIGQLKGQVAQNLPPQDPPVPPTTPSA